MMLLLRALALGLASLVLCYPASGADSAPGKLTVGSKRFTESYILGELVCQTLQTSGAVRLRCLFRPAEN